jgi:hypothetical protein
MPRNIVICCDGTGNQYGSANSNVVTQRDKRAPILSALVADMLSRDSPIRLNLRALEVELRAELHGSAFAKG